MDDVDLSDMTFKFGRTIGAIAWICNIALQELSPEQRVLFFGRIITGYCKHCGECRQKGTSCFCTRDE